MRHPTLRLFQLMCAVTATAGASLARPLPAPPEKPVWVSVLGESEREDGSWTGFDLLQSPEAQIDRFQITLRPERRVRVRLEAVTSQGTEQLFPARAGDAALAAGRAFALPGPRTFFELRGQARLRLFVALENDTPGAEIPVRLAGIKRQVRYPLTDGSAARIGEWSFVPSAGRLAVLEHPVHGR